MCFCKEVVGIHTCGKHSRKRTCRLIRLNSRCQNDQVGINMQLLVGDQVRGLDLELIALRNDLAYHTLNILNTVFLYCTAIELVKVFARSSYVDIENINLGIGIFITRIIIACFAVYIQQILEQ